jgi:ADP-heptose:LPS heptosyltransferase
MRHAAVILPATDLGELAAVVARLDLLLAHDSGVRHVAVARGTPTLCLYGPTDPRNWNPPLGPHHGLRAGVPCVGCNLTVCTHHLCMRLLEPEAVARRGLAVLASEARSVCGS